MKIFSPILKGTTTVSQGTTNLSGSFTGSLFGTAATASYADNFTVGGTLTAQTINVQTITSSIEFITGSTRNGSLAANTHQFTGSVLMTGSLSVVTTGTELQVNAGGVNIGNSLTDSHIISGSVRINPNGLFVSSSANVGIGTITPNTKLDVNGNALITGSLTTTSNLSIGGVVTLTNGTSNRITWGTVGVAAPTLTSYSAGVKLVLYDNIGVSNAGYTIGIEAGTMFFTTGVTADAYKWYGGTTQAATLSGTGTFTCISLTETSSKRYKENINTLDNALYKVICLRGVSYNRKENTTKEIGVIAEEVEQILPEVINYNKENQADSVSYGRLTAVLIEAIKEQQQQIEELKSLLGK